MWDKKSAHGKQYRNIITGIFLIMAFLCRPLEVSASWTENADNSIYSEGKNTEAGEEKAEGAGSFERKISGLFRNLATGMNDLLLKEGCDLDRIILGRVKSGGQESSLFTFELRTGNVYGVVAASVYKVLRSIIFVVIAGVMLAKLVRGQFTSGNARAREEMKGAFFTTVTGCSLLVLMPFLYDIFLYFRDVVLYSVSSETAGDMGLIENFYAMSSESGLFTDAILYLAAVCSSLWFAFEYIGIAMASVIMFICFSFVTVLMFYDRNKLTNWCWNVFSLGITPIIDISMLMIPVFMGRITEGKHPFMQLLVTWSVIPSRKLFKNALGLTSTGEAVLSGLSAIAMIHGVTSLMRGGTGLAKNTGEKLKGSMEDRKKQHYHEDMADIRERENTGFSGSDGYMNEKHGKWAGIKGNYGIFQERKEGMEEAAMTQAESESHMASGIQQTESGTEYTESINTHEREVMRKHATVNNFEQMEFARLDHATKAELYRKRARKRLFQGIGMGLAGTAGLAGGTLIGVSATGFYSHGASAMVTGAFAGGGAALGGMLGSMAGGGISGISGSRGIRETRNTGTGSGLGHTPAPEATPAAETGISSSGEIVLRRMQYMDIRENQELHFNPPASGTGLEVLQPVKQQVQDIVSNPAARSVVREFCQEMAVPGSRVMQSYEQSARNAVSGTYTGLKYNGYDFRMKVNGEIANQMSGDIMKRIVERGVSIPSNAVYGPVRSNIESNIRDILKQWSDMSEFRD